MDDKKKHRWIAIGAFAAGVVVAIFLMTTFNVGIGDKAYVSYTEYENAKKVADKYAELENLYGFLKENYYTELKDEDLMTGIYKGLFGGAGDIYTRYLTAEEYQEIRDAVDGTFQGIGITMNSSKDGYVQVLSVFEDSPAEKAGIQAGDRILAVNGEILTGNDLEHASSRIKGEAGTSVTLTIRRGDQEKIVNVVRAAVEEVSVVSEVLEDNIGYIRIRSFVANTAELFEEQLAELEAKKVDGLIIDLRSNGGGVVNASVRIADQIMDDGTIVYMEDGKGKRTYLTSQEGRTSLKYVILVNGGTASASEILTAGVQDNDEGTIIGTKTYGKGITQQVIKLKNGDGIELTIDQYFSPKGRVIHQKGLTPDIVVELEESDVKDGVLVNDRQLQAAEDYLKTH